MSSSLASPVFSAHSLAQRSAPACALLADLEPRRLWSWFAQLSALPRLSKQEAAVLAWIEAQADAHGLAHRRDCAGNLIVSKAASPGRESAVGVVLQSHVDMVAQKRPASRHDFSRDPLQLRIDGDWLMATDTTLGADNGLGVAAMLAVLTDASLAHGPLEALFTVDEEAGMGGAKGLEAGILQGRWLLNLDTEVEGELYVGCAGGMDANIVLQLPLQDCPADTVALALRLGGLRGGHSGIDIHRGRGNAVQLMAGVLLQLARAGVLAGVSHWTGGSLRNALARESEAVILVRRSDLDQCRRLCQAIMAPQHQWLAAVEPHLDFRLEELPVPMQMTPASSLLPPLQAMLCCPHGPLRACDAFPSVVETSNNLARVSLVAGLWEVQCLARSTCDAGLAQACEKIRCAFELCGARVVFDNGYPGWTPAPASPLLQHMQRLYERLFGVGARIQVIHAGLECGMLQAKYPHWEMISFGPTIEGAHSPDERLQIESVGRFWRYLVAALETLSDR